MAFYAGLDSETYDRQYSNKALETGNPIILEPIEKLL